MLSEAYFLAKISWSSFCCGCSIFGIWFFIITSFSPVKHYLCIWLLILQFVYHSLTLISTLLDTTSLARLSRLLLSINFSMSSVITFVSISARQGMEEIFRIDNFSLHVLPTVLNFIELLISTTANDDSELERFLQKLWDIFLPVIIMLFYYNLFFAAEVYERQFKVDLPSSIIVALLSGTLVVLAKREKMKERKGEHLRKVVKILSHGI